jgi:hypothetical protein
MAITEQDMKRAEERMESARGGGYAVAARYDRRRSRVVVKLNTGVELTFPTELAEGLRGAPDEALAKVEISPGGLGLHWPKLDTDLYVPAMIQGVFGNRRWMARELGSKGGSARSVAKSAAARLNGRKGGRPRKAAGA